MVAVVAVVVVAVAAVVVAAVAAAVVYSHCFVVVELHYQEGHSGDKHCKLEEV